MASNMQENNVTITSKIHVHAISSRLWKGNILTGKRLCDLSSSDAEKPEQDNVAKDAESQGTPETHTCNGSADRKACKHQSKREQLERERELLRRQGETPNQEEECQESGMEGEDINTELQPRS